jgi:hypothetical protein
MTHGIPTPSIALIVCRPIFLHPYDWKYSAMPNGEFPKFPPALPELPTAADWKRDTNAVSIGGRVMALLKGRSEPLKAVDRALETYEFQRGSYDKLRSQYKENSEKVTKANAQGQGGEHRNDWIKEIERIVALAQRIFGDAAFSYGEVNDHFQTWQEQKAYLQLSRTGATVDQAVKRNQGVAVTNLRNALEAGMSRFKPDALNVEATRRIDAGTHLSDLKPAGVERARAIRDSVVAERKKRGMASPPATAAQARAAVANNELPPVPPLPGTNGLRQPQRRSGPLGSTAGLSTSSGQSTSAGLSPQNPPPQLEPRRRTPQSLSEVPSPTLGQTRSRGAPLAQNSARRLRRSR